jgi:NAD(P)H-dependent FMN reductase
MIIVISGTNRPGSNTVKIAAEAVERLRSAGEEVRVLDLTELPRELFDGESYAEKPPGLAPFQEAILAADGIVTVVPEYNGGFPGVMKYFIDMLRFPDSLYEKPAAFIGLSAGPWGAIRGVEQLEAVFRYRHANIFGRRVFLPSIGTCLDDHGRLNDEAAAKRLDEMLLGFIDFCGRLEGCGRRPA